MVVLVGISRHGKYCKVVMYCMVNRDGHGPCPMVGQHCSKRQEGSVRQSRGDEFAAEQNVSEA